jgi:hypothetical protein
LNDQQRSSEALLEAVESFKYRWVSNAALISCGK